MRGWECAIGLAAVLAVVTSCSRRTRESGAGEAAANPVASELAELAASEELILHLTPATRRLGDAAAARKIPDPRTQSLFADSVEVNSLLAGKPDPDGGYSIPDMAGQFWPVTAEVTSVRREELEIWPEFLRTIESFSEAKFYPIRGQFLDRERERFRCATGLEALARTPNGWRQVTGGIELTWRRREPGSVSWEIVEWKTTHLQAVDSPRLFFEEALERALPRAEDLMRARHCQHERHLVDYFKKGGFDLVTDNPLAGKYLDLDSTWQHPSLSAADVDGDGWDDLYLTQRWGRNLLLRNNRNGTFTDVAGALGLDIKDFCNASLFADFDNDGDQDVFIGRSLEPSLYLVNEDGRFVDRSADRVATPLPKLVSSLAAADFDGDGWLDIYLGTYGPTASQIPVSEWSRELLAPEVAAEMEKRAAGSHRYLDLAGPPNLLLRNTGGGKFAVAPQQAQLADWHNTNQAAWSDYDDDGDPDLYVSNDFGPGTLYRNDGARGFSDVTREAAGSAMQGFGMGASWADYDGDGRLDLYVSNMYSKAGRRITAQIPGLDPRTPYSADGSLLFHNTGGRFEQLAGTEPPALMVARVGWAYGGQFCDFDNDTWLDVFAPSGFYSAPQEIAEDRDL